MAKKTTNRLPAAPKQTVITPAMEQRAKTSLAKAAKGTKLDPADIFLCATVKGPEMGMAEFCRVVNMSQNSVRHALFNQSQKQERPVPQFSKGSRKLSDSVTVQQSGQIVISKARIPASWHQGDQLSIEVIDSGKTSKLIISKSK